MLWKAIWFIVTYSLESNIFMKLWTNLESRSNLYRALSKIKRKALLETTFLGDSNFRMGTRGRPWLNWHSSCTTNLYTLALDALIWVHGFNPDLQQYVSMVPCLYTDRRWFITSSVILFISLFANHLQPQSVVPLHCFGGLAFFLNFRCLTRTWHKTFKTSFKNTIFTQNQDIYATLNSTSGLATAIRLHKSNPWIMNLFGKTSLSALVWKLENTTLQMNSCTCTKVAELTTLSFLIGILISTNWCHLTK